MIAKMFKSKYTKTQSSITVSLLLQLLVGVHFIGHFHSQVVEGLEDGDDQVGPLWLNGRALPEKPSEKLAELLGRVGPSMRASADYHDFQDIALKDSIEAWRLLREQSRKFAKNQVDFYRPRLIQLFKDSNVSSECLASMEFLLNSMEKLDSWAIKMWNFNGNFPPTGLFDGQFTDLGSYRGCVDNAVPWQFSGDHENNGSSMSHDYASYCVVAFRPIVPSRRRFHMIFQREQSELLDIFTANQTTTEDAFSSALQFAQYFHYIYMKTGVCLTSQCSHNDVQLVANSAGRKLALMPGPVKCFTRSTSAALLATTNRTEESSPFGRIQNQPILVNLGEKLNTKQWVSLAIVGSFFGLVALATAWHLAELLWAKFSNKPALDELDDVDGNCSSMNHHIHEENINEKSSSPLNANSVYVKTLETSRLKHWAFYYFSALTNGEEFFQTKASKSNEIRCLHGFRAITMIWIICVHTLQYNEWSEFTRVFENVASLQNPFLHPMLNANNAVDTFFLMSGLLAAYTNWSSKKVAAHRQNKDRFNIVTSLLARYLRLTPQSMLVALLYILLPLIGDGPFWFDMTHHESKYCESNWWVNLLHLQAFYRDNEMCNLVSWWISVDMLYYALALLLLWLLFQHRTGTALLGSSVYVGYCLAVMYYRHYTGGYTPNNLGTVPQVAEVWTWFVVNFSWSPYSHAYVFFAGFWVGYMMALNKWRQQVRNWSRFGWIVASLTLIVINLSSHLWMADVIGLENQTLSTSYNIVCSILWSNAVCWLIVACHYGCLSNLNRFLSTQLAVILSKASFIIYLSHMLIVRAIYGSRYFVLEVSLMTILLLLMGNIIISSAFGILLSITFEGPCMKFQRYVISLTKSTQANNVDSHQQSVIKESSAKNGKSNLGVILLQ